VPWQAARFLPSFPRFFRGYVMFSGRAARPELFWWVLWWIVLTGVANVPFLVAFVAGIADPATLAPSSPPPTDLSPTNPFPVWAYLLSTMPPLMLVSTIIGGVIALACLLPWVALAVRRLHDGNRSGWWVLLSVVPVGNVLLLVLLTVPTDERAARYDLPG
jgi:uncharacterized membrane protein YhaH (DUF805 family)